MGLILLKAIVFLATTGWLVLKAINEVKEPYDQKKETFSMSKDFWPFHWDNIAILVVGCIIGFALSHELGVPLINSMVELPEILETGLDLTAILASTFGVGFLLDKAYSKK